MRYTGNDHDPFGMLLVERNWQSTTTYKYGFNGKENVDDVYGNDVAVDFGARIYDGRLGRWFSVDPAYIDFAFSSPFTFVSNNPIILVDPDGEKETLYLTIINKDGSKTVLIKTTYNKFKTVERSERGKIDTHDTHKVYDIYDYSVYAVLDLSGLNPKLTVSGTKLDDKPVISGAPSGWFGRFQAMLTQPGGTMFSASNGQGQETKIGDPDAIVNIDLIFQAAGLNKPTYSTEKIYEGTKFLKTLGKIKEAADRVSDVKEVGELLKPTIESIETMIKDNSTNHPSEQKLKICEVCHDTLDVNDQTAPWHPRYDTIPKPKNEP